MKGGDADPLPPIPAAWRPVLSKARWYASRLRSMSAGEIAHRVREQVKRAAWRRYDEGFARFAADDGALPVIPGVQEKLLGPCSPSFDAMLARAAERTLTAPFGFLGATWPGGLLDGDGVPAAEAWLIDPVTRLPWEGAESYCFSIPYRARRDRGDVKFVWEINRLQFIPPVAVHGARTGRTSDCAAYVVAVIKSWMAANPPFRGINWSSGIELALRIVSLSLAVTALGRDAFRAKDRALFRTFLRAHAFWLDRFESNYSSANNHLVVEGLGLFVAGALCPDLADATKWEAKGRAILDREVALQILDDGVGAELSPAYTSFTVEACLFALLVARAVGRPLRDTVGQRPIRAGTWLRWMMDEGGHVPEIGDNDGGRVVALEQEPEPDYVASVLSATAAMTGSADIAPPRSPEHLRDLLFGRPAGPSASPAGLRTFTDGGYSVWRGMLGARRALLVFDHGPLGYLSIAAHGHADTLAVWLHLDDRPVLVDTGTYLYFGDPSSREYARSSLAHNTLTVAGKSSSETAGPFNWRRKATGRLVAHRVDEGSVTLVGEHDGYENPFGLTHRRSVRVSPSRAVVEIADRLTGDRDVEVDFLIAPELTISDGSRLVVSGPDGNLLDVGGPPLAAEVIHGRDGVERGRASRAFGSREPATLLAFRGNVRGGKDITTLLKIL